MLWVRFPLGEMYYYLLICLFLGSGTRIKAWRWVPPLNTQCFKTFGGKLGTKCLNNRFFGFYIYICGVQREAWFLIMLYSVLLIIYFCKIAYLFFKELRLYIRPTTSYDDFLSNRLHNRYKIYSSNIKLTCKFATLFKWMDMVKGKIYH